MQVLGPAAPALGFLLFPQEWRHTTECSWYDGIKVLPSQLMNLWSSLSILGTRFFSLCILFPFGITYSSSLVPLQVKSHWGTDLSSLLRLGSLNQPAMQGLPYQSWWHPILIYPCRFDRSFGSWWLPPLPLGGHTSKNVIFACLSSGLPWAYSSPFSPW